MTNRMTLDSLRDAADEARAGDYGLERPPEMTGRSDLLQESRSTLKGPGGGRRPHAGFLKQGGGGLLGEIRKAVEAATAFMSVGRELKKAGIKYDFSTEPLPIYLVVKGGEKIAIVNKKHATEPDFVVGQIAVGRINQ